MNSTLLSQPLQFDGTSDMAALMNQYNWAESSVGPVAGWPKSLFTTVDLMLHASFPMFLVWGKARTCFYNDAFCPVLSEEKSAYITMGKNATEVWKESWPLIAPLINAALEGEQTGLYEDQLIPVIRQGKQEDAYWTFSYSPVKNDQGQIEGVLAIVYETTKKVAERKVAETTQQQLQLALEACDLGTWELNPRTMSFKCNEKTKEIFGLGRLQNIDLQIAINVIEPDDRPRVQRAIKEAFDYNNGGDYQIDYTVVHPQTGLHRTVRAMGRVYFDHLHMPEAFTGTIRDITEEKKASRNNEKLQQLVEHSSHYMSMATLEGKLTYMNPAGRRLIGLPEEKDLAGMAIKDFYSPEQYAIIKEVVIPALNQTGKWSGFVKILYQPTGIEIPCYGNYMLVKDPATGRTISRALTLRDLRPDLQAKKELEDSEIRFRNLVQEAPVATAIYTGRKMTIQWANHAMIDLWGKNEKVIGKTVREALPEIEGQPFHQLLDHVYTTGETYQATEGKAELVVNGKLQTFYFNFSYKPLRDTHGDIYGILNMAIDVTQTVLNKRKLEESEKDFRNLIMKAPVGICLLSGDNDWVDIANEQYLAIVGRTKEELVNRPIWEALPEAKAQGFDKIIQQVKETGVAYLGNEYPVDLLRNGKMERLYVNFVYEPLTNEKGEVHNILVIAIDISQQVLLRHQIEHAEERARLAAVSGNLGTYEVNLATQEIIASARFHELFDMEDPGRQNDYVSKIHPDDLPVRAKAYEEALASGMLQYTCRVQHKNNKEIWVQIYGHINYDAHQKPYKIIGFVQDITHRVNIEQELEKRVEERTAQLLRVNAELQQFNYISSHDMKEPLRKIQVFGSMARQLADAGNISLMTSLDKVMSAASRMHSLLTDLLNYSTLSDTPPTFEKVDLNKVVQHVIEDSEIAISEKEAAITVNPLPVVEGIGFQLKQLFFNLIQNALKFNKSGMMPEVTIQSETLSEAEKATYALPAEKAFFKITVSDNGVGFDAAYAEKIFVVFQRLHDRNSYPGNGIGLSLCKKIVENHHGIILANGQVDTGSVFTLILPQKQQERKT